MSFSNMISPVSVALQINKLSWTRRPSAVVDKRREKMRCRESVEHQPFISFCESTWGRLE